MAGMVDVLTVVLTGFDNLHRNVIGKPEITVTRILKLGGGDPSQGKAVSVVLAELCKRKLLKRVSRHGNRIVYVERTQVSSSDIIRAYNEVMTKKYSSKIRFNK